MPTLINKWEISSEMLNFNFMEGCLIGIHGNSPQHHHEIVPTHYFKLTFPDT